MHPLGVDLVVVLVHRKVQRALDAEQPHVGLHLRVVRGLALADAVLLQVGEALRAVRLHLEDRPGLRRLGEAATDTVDRAAEVPALVAALDLLAVLVGVQLDANAAQFLGNDRLLALAAVEQAQHPPVPGGRCRPPERVPDVPIASVPDQRRAEVLTRFLRLLGAPLQHGARCRVLTCRHLRHRSLLLPRPPSRPSAGGGRNGRPSSRGRWGGS